MSRLQTLNIRICLLLATVLITGGINAQDFYKFISQADSLHNAGDYSEADKIYDIAFQNREDAPYGFYYNAAFNNALAKNYEKSIAQFKYTIEKGLIDFESLLEDSDLSELREQDEWRIVSTLIQEREEQLNRPLISKLEWLREKDQLFRQLAACKEQLSNKQTEIFEQVSLQYDSLNVQEVTELIDANGECMAYHSACRY